VGVFVDSKGLISNDMSTIEDDLYREGFVKNIWKCAIIIFMTVSCAPGNPPVENKALASGSAEEKRAIAEMKRLAIQHGYHPEKMDMQIKSNSETGNFSIFLFPKTVDSKSFHREDGLFAIVNAQSGQVIRFSDPKTDPK
jgi:hypothetical protein